MTARRIKDMVEGKIGLGFKIFFYNSCYKDKLVDLDEHVVWADDIGSLRWFKLSSNHILVYSLYTDVWLSNKNVRFWFKLLYRRIV